jgi:hypothetical protein
VLGEFKCKKTQQDFNDAEREESSTEEKKPPCNKTKRAAINGGPFDMEQMASSSYKTQQVKH